MKTTNYNNKKSFKYLHLSQMAYIYLNTSLFKILNFHNIFTKMRNEDIYSTKNNTTAGAS